MVEAIDDIGRRAVMKLKTLSCRNSIGRAVYKTIKRNQAKFSCPICHYRGPFFSFRSLYGVRRNAICPQCGSYERHRLQFLVMEEIAQERDLEEMAALHCAPEPYFDQYREKFGKYVTTDLYLEDVDVKADLTDLPFEDESFDLVYASHVLQYIQDDAKALAEISRILKADGIAILPVPVVSSKTVEYPEPNMHESKGHVRAPGPDYYDRFLDHFDELRRPDSTSYPDEYQTYIYEDRRQWPATMPLRETMEGEKHIDIVPVCVGARRRT